MSTGVYGVSHTRFRLMTMTRLCIATPWLLVAAAAATVGSATQAVGAQAPIPHWRGAVDLTIGGENASDEATFGSISGLAVDAQGRIFIADGQDQQVRVFSPTGRFLARIGRSGSGPLEFKRLATIGFGPDRLLWARDEGNARLLGIDVSVLPARGVKNVPLTQFTGGSRLPLTFMPDGSHVDESIYFEKASESFRQVRLTRNEKGVVTRTDTLPIPPGANDGVFKITKVQKDANGKQIGMSQGYLWQPFGPQWLRAYGPGGVRAEVVTSRYAVTVFGANGRVVATLTSESAPVPLSARERRTADSTLSDSKSDLPFGVPTAKAPIVGLYWSVDGNLWVELAVLDGKPREAVVYDRSGKLLAIAEWPATIDLQWGYPAISGKTVVAKATDADGSERVVRLRFR